MLIRGIHLHAGIRTAAAIQACQRCCTALSKRRAAAAAAAAGVLPGARKALRRV